MSREAFLSLGTLVECLFFLQPWFSHQLNVELDEEEASEDNKGHAHSWNMAKRSFETRPAIPLMVRDTSLVGKGILPIPFQDVHAEASCELPLPKVGAIRMRLRALYHRNSSQAH